jgi:arginine exporter protein ArgO
MKKYLAFLGAAIFCPCHVPLWAGLFAGTAFGAFLAQNLIWLFIVLTVGFLFFLGYGWRLVAKERS